MKFTRILAFMLLTFSYLNCFSQDKKPLVSLKYGDGLRIMATDSSMYLKIGFRMQQHTEFNYNNSNNEIDFSYQLRRVRLKLSGWAFSKKLGYYIQLALEPTAFKTSNDLTSLQEGNAGKIILDALVKWNFHNQHTLIVGQTKLPGNREWIVSSQHLQFVNRSILNQQFSIDRDIALQMNSIYTFHSSALRTVFALSLGEGRNIQVSNIGGLGYSGRIEYFPFGLFDDDNDYKESSLGAVSTPKMSIGLSYDFINKAARQKGRTGKFLVDNDNQFLQTNLSSLFIDYILTYRQFSSWGEYSYTHSSQQNLGFQYGQGWHISAAYLFKKNWETGIRYAHIKPNQDDQTFDQQSEYTIGLTKYFKDHSLKLQSDWSIGKIKNDDDYNFIWNMQFEFAF